MYKPQMIDMGRSIKKEEEEPEKAMSSEYEGPRYPWGLAMSLQKEELDKLGLDFESLQIGGILSLTAIAKVTAKSRNESESGEERTCVELQITHLGVDDGMKTNNDNRAEGRYKESNR